MTTNADLLRELRIDRSSGPPPSRRGLWIGLAVALVVALLAAVAVAMAARRHSERVLGKLGIHSRIDLAETLGMLRASVLTPHGADLRTPG